jgi:hypothetical protein
MEIKELKQRGYFTNEKNGKCYQKFSTLIDELLTLKLSSKVINFTNEQVDFLNKIQEEKKLKRQVKVCQQKILRLLEKEHKIVPIGYYRNLWMVLRMSSFGLPLGVAFGASLSNMGLLGVGLPIGMVIGIAVGLKKDNQAAKEGRQLKYSIAI